MRATEGEFSNKSVNDPGLAVAFGPDANDQFAAVLKVVPLVMTLRAAFAEKEHSKDRTTGSQSAKRWLDCVLLRPNLLETDR